MSRTTDATSSSPASICIWAKSTTRDDLWGHRLLLLLIVLHISSQIETIFLFSRPYLIKMIIYPKSKEESNKYDLP